MRVAAIDIGTVTSRLLIADVDQRGVHTVKRYSAITNLGVGVDSTGVLDRMAIERTVDQAAQFKRDIDACAQAGRPVERTVALATSASRDARNSDEFEGKLRELGIELTVIPGEREAGLSFLGAANEFRGEDVVVSDIGGGSTEVVFGRTDGQPTDVVPKATIAARHSFNIGCRRMTERFFSADPPTKKELAGARAWVLEGLRPFLTQGLPCDRLVAVAGTPTSVVAVRDRLVPYDSTKVHKAVVTREQLDGVAEQVYSLPLAERKKLPGLQPERALVFPAGLVILTATMDLLGVDTFTASESDLLMGIVLDAAR
jgi:exopolyphosphatase/guanosine-5'-triphosphate,3'-diphosphate pyrophosphatase